MLLLNAQNSGLLIGQIPQRKMLYQHFHKNTSLDLNLFDKYGMFINDAVLPKKKEEINSCFIIQKHHLAFPYDGDSIFTNINLLTSN